MPFSSRYAILLDGGFVIKKLNNSIGRFPTADDVAQLCEQIQGNPLLHDFDLLRIYFYHAPPAKGILNNPIDKRSLDLTKTKVFGQNESLLDKLELKPNFALRLGETVIRDWLIGAKAMKDLMKKQRQILANDLVPNISQKGVDLRIGLDIARLALRDMVRLVVVVTGDSDLVPAFKFARREGVRIYLYSMGHGIRRELKAHADIVL